MKVNLVFKNSTFVFILSKLKKVDFLIFSTSNMLLIHSKKEIEFVANFT